MALEFLKIEEIKELLWIPEGMSGATVAARLLQALEFYQEIAPQDGMEGMLAMQMVGTHHAAMECLRRAAIPDQTYEGRDMALKHAQKLMTLYSQQLAALNKHRGKGQKVIVEHVQVHSGGQAIVGHVETGGKVPQISAAPVPLGLENMTEMPIAATKTRKTSGQKR